MLSASYYGYCYRFYARTVEQCCQCYGGHSRIDSASWSVLRSGCEIEIYRCLDFPWWGGVVWRTLLTVQRVVSSLCRRCVRWNWASVGERVWGGWVRVARRTCDAGMDQLRSSLMNKFTKLAGVLIRRYMYAWILLANTIIASLKLQLVDISVI